MTLELRLDRDASILGPAPGPSHNRLHPDVPPVAEIEPGDEVVADVRDGMDGFLRAAASADALLDADLSSNHPLTGPVAVRGATPGDVLLVELLDIEPAPVGHTAVLPGFGVLGDRFSEPLIVRWEIADGVARSMDMPGVAIAGRPFLGTVAVAPSAGLLARAARREALLAQRGGLVLAPDARGAVPGGAIAREGLRTIPPRENGGNLDIRQLTTGSRLHLPVQVDGALLSLGDAHFAQGDGECCGTAIEVPATVRVRVELRRAADGARAIAMPAYEYAEEPRAEPRRWFATTGIPVDAGGANAEMDLRLAARNALDALVDWIAAERGLTPAQAYVLASVAADLRISEAVNVPNGLVSAALPLDVFED
jgi:formamidase